MLRLFYDIQYISLLPLYLLKSIAMHTASQLKNLRRTPLSYPDLGPWAGVLMLLCSIFMVGSRFTTDPFVQLPTQVPSFRCRLEGPDVVISVNKENQYYLTIYGTNLQAAIIKQVAERHNVSLSNKQIVGLDKLTFIGQAVQQLPLWLSASPFQRHNFAKGIPTEIHDDQFSEYIAAANSIFLKQRGRYPSYGIRADKRLSAARIKRVFQLLKNQNIHYFSLAAEFK